MTRMDYIQCLVFSLPMFIALMCVALLLMFRHRNRDSTQRRLSGLMMWLYGVVAFGWFGMVLYMVDYHAHVWVKTPFFFALMLSQVLLYRFIFAITGTGSRERFPRMHYVVPVILAATQGIWSLATPYEVQYYIIESRGDPAPGYELFTRFYTSNALVFIVYSIVYPLAGLLRIGKFRRAVVHYSADEQRSSVRWVYTQIVLLWLMLPFASGLLFVHKSVFFSSAVTVCMSLLPVVQYLFICHHLMAGNYMIIQPPRPEEAEGERSKGMERSRFESYMRQRKPYLDPKLRITDLCLALGTNRSYLSGFINREYGVNFSRYINGLRLEELERIRLSPKNKGLPGVDLVLQAGFSSYRSYLRVKQLEDSRRVVRIFD